MKAFFHTLGCKVNQYETEAMRGLMAAAGFETGDYTPGDTLGENAVVVINSCTVTGESDRKLRQLLRRCRRDNPDCILVLTGCMPQAFPAAAEALHEADIVLGNAARSVLPERVNQFCTLGQRIVDVSAHKGEIERMSIRGFEGHTRAFVKIEDGCDRFCSYCIIPYARGRVRSRTPEDIRAELAGLAEKGYTEVVLVGINLTAYGSEQGLTLADAVETACAVPGIRRVRLGSLEPDHMTPELIRRLAAQEKLCPQFHLSLQSGCDDTLRRMNRHYTSAEYAAVCAELREAFPHCALTTDVMVGFAGETEEEFARSLAFVEQIAFARVHVFAYSRRPGTKAAELPGQVSAAVKTERSHRMASAAADSAARYHAEWVGQTVEVLAETEHEDGTVDGYTPQYVPVRIRGGAVSGDIVNVRIDGADAQGCTGTVEK